MSTVSKKSSSSSKSGKNSKEGKDRDGKDRDGKDGNKSSSGITPSAAAVNTPTGSTTSTIKPTTTGVSLTSGTSASGGRSTPTKRLLHELTTYQSQRSHQSYHVGGGESQGQSHSSSSSSSPGIENVSPVSAADLFSWRAILNGSALPAASGYSGGRWLLSIAIPGTYPTQPPHIKFVTKICHPNVKWDTGEVCLDVLADNWRPVLGVLGCLESILRLLAEPGVDSPLGLEVASLLRNGDSVGARSLVGFWATEERFEGVLEDI